MHIKFYMGQMGNIYKYNMSDDIEEKQDPYYAHNG